MKSWRRKEIPTIMALAVILQKMPQVKKTRLEEKVQMFFTHNYNKQDLTSCD